MLSLTRVNSGQAKTYYAKDDYYLESGGKWQGNGATLLNLTGTIEESKFNLLIQGKAPNDEFRIQTGGKESKHTAGVDLTFSAPKSVSIAGLVLEDGRILEAHDKAVADTLNYIESNLSQVRIHTDGRVLLERTDNLIFAKFQHIASRELDPQLHTHCVVLNASQKSNGDWRAVDYKEMFDNKKMLGHVYRNELAKNLQELGYSIKAESNGFFELNCISPEIIKEFSVRSEQIKARAAELKSQFPHASAAKLKAMATIDSRKVKDEPSLAELKSQWESRISEYQLNKEVLKEAFNASNERDLRDSKSIDVNKVILDAARSCVTREAVVSKEQILNTALKNSMGNYSIKELESALNNHGELKGYENNRYFTTKELANIETGIINNVKSWQNTQSILLNEEQIKFGIVNYELKHGFKLTEDQKKGVMHILNSQDKVTAIQGDAGTGKTTMLDCVNDIVKKENLDLDLKGLSFTGKAAFEIEQASKIESQTVARYIHGNMEQSYKPGLLIVDEASMLSIKDMNALLNKVDDNSRIVLIGDTKQLQSIGAGKIFSTLQSEEAINTITMKESKRQTELIYKETAMYMSEKMTEKAFDKLDGHGKIIEVNDRGHRLEAIADKYCANYKDTILVTRANIDRRELNSQIRDKLQNQGQIGNKDVSLMIREAKNLSDEQKLDCSNYAKGDLIVVNNAALGKAGMEGNITMVDGIKNTITISDKSSNIYEINLKDNSQALSIYNERLNKFTIGDKIVFLKNDKGLGVNNGQVAIIQDIDENGKAKLQLENNQSKTVNLNTQYKYIDHGYALTDYKSQGQTANNVIYHADTARGVNYNQAYVGITRGREDIAIYTDDKEKFKSQISLEQYKTTIRDFERNMMQPQEKNKSLGIQS